MQLIVDTYACEWKELINHELRKRFTHFVNAPEVKDPTVQFEPLRDQIKAKE